MGALDGRVAIVTGGSGAVGSAISLALAAEGARIVMTGGAGFAASGAAGTRARCPDSRLSGAIGGTLTFELA